jgi:cytoskeletal protein CcmA (bactofilin family)
MFSRKTKSTIDSLIGSTTRIEGDLHFKGGLRIDGHIRGNVIADTESLSMLVISEQAVIDGEVRAAHIVVNGVINGPVFSTELLELQPKAKFLVTFTTKLWRCSVVLWYPVNSRMILLKSLQL